MSGIVSVLLYSLVGIAAGTVGGLFGVGGGIIMVPVLVLLFSKPQHLSQGTSFAAMIPLAIAGCVRYQLKGNVDWNIAIGLTIGAVIGVTFIGAPLAHHLKESMLRKLFGVLMVVAGLRMLGVFQLIGAAIGIVPGGGAQ